MQYELNIEFSVSCGVIRSSPVISARLSITIRRSSASKSPLSPRFMESMTRCRLSSACSSAE